MQREAEILKHTFKVKVISSKKLKKINTWIPSQLERLDCVTLMIAIPKKETSQEGFIFCPFHSVAFSLKS